jgi:DNA invertase Pin-like site-specific DNA recombinase
VLAIIISALIGLSGAHSVRAPVSSEICRERARWGTDTAYEKIDTSSAAGELVFHVFGAIAHFERRLIAERTRDGIAAARAEGRTPGRPPLNPETLQAAIILIRNGMSPTKAARQVGLGRSTVYRELAMMPSSARQTA